MALDLIVAGLIGYLLGAIPTGVLLTRLLGKPDVRSSGSKHTGGLNVTRQAGIPAGALTAILDALKGAAAVTLALWLFDSPWAAAVAGVLAVVGHDWSAYLRFAGGIGLSTLAGAQVRATPLPGLYSVLVLGAAWLLLMFVAKVHRARSTILMMLLVGPALWFLGAGLPGILLGALGGLVVIAKTVPDWNRVYDASPTIRS